MAEGGREELRLVSDSQWRGGSLDSTENAYAVGTQMQTGRSESCDSLDQSSTVYHCIFHVLPCEHAFGNAGDWKAHVLGHFQGHSAPVDVRCAWCGISFDSTNTAVVYPPEYDPDIGSEPVSPGTIASTRVLEYEATTASSPSVESLQVWHSLLDHIAQTHLSPNQDGRREDKDLFPHNNYTLMQYLYWSKSISESQFKAAVQLVPPATSPTTTTATTTTTITTPPATTTAISYPNSSPPLPESPPYRRLSRRHSSQQQDELLRASVGSSDEPFVAGYSPRRERKLREQHQQQQ